MSIYLVTREEIFRDVCEQRIEEEERNLSVAMPPPEVNDNEFCSRNSMKYKFVARPLMRHAELSNNSISSIIEL